jgi:Spy/CpxP family protein refolding chaperone
MDWHDVSRSDRQSIYGERSVKQSIKILAVIFSVALNIAFLAGYGIRKFSDRSKFAYEEVNLSKEQRAQMQNARDRFLHDLNEIGNDIVKRQIETIDLIAADSVDRRAIETKFEEIQLFQQSMHQRVVEHLLEHKQIFNPEQREKFFEVLKSRIREQSSPGPPWMPTDKRKRE